MRIKGTVDYSKSNAIFCINHFKILLNKINNSKISNELIMIQKEKLNSLYETLIKFIDKHDYRNKDPITKEENEAVDRVIEAIKGYKNSLNFNFYYNDINRKGRKLFKRR